MKLDQFLSFVESGNIPPEPPDGAGDMLGDNYLSLVQARSKCIRLGMWPVVDKVWIKALADWIGNRQVLEVMAGGGWIAKALSEFGISVYATDDYSWNDHQHKNMKPVFPIIKMGAVEAVKKKTKADILLVSWPPYADNTIIEVCNAWGKADPIIYIGEGQGGCNAPDKFFERFRSSKTYIPLQSWPGLHDSCLIGYWA